MTHPSSTPPSLARWRALAEQALKGAPFERLVSHHPGGLAIQPLYVQGDGAQYPALARARARAWDARQIVACANPAMANGEAIADLEGGAASIEIEVAGPAGGRGVALAEFEDLAQLTAGWMLDLAPMALSADAPEASSLLFRFAKARGLLDTAFAFNRDPIGAALRGAASSQDAGALMEAIAFADKVATDFPQAKALRLDARPVHEAGASEAQEIGVMAASLAAYLRAGLPPGLASQACLATLALGSDPLLEIAKLRAARLVLGRIQEVIGAKPAPFTIQAVTGKRALTRRDPWVNLLRAAGAGFAGAVGGADVLTILPMSEALGQPTPFTRRLARNLHPILGAEAHLAQVCDPAAGAYAFEALTEELAAGGWAFFQDIERQGGLLAALAGGWLAAQIAPIRAAREARIRSRKDAITGVSEFPLLNERTLEAAPWPLAAPSPALGAGLGLTRWRMAAPFEALRDRAEAAGHPSVFLANLGAQQEFAPRAGFVANLLACGGLRALGPETEYPDLPSLIAGYRASGASIACLCGSDRTYAEGAPPAGAALKAAGCTLVLLAGRPGKAEPALRAAGIEDFLHAGGDAIAALQALHAHLGLEP